MNKPLWALFASAALLTACNSEASGQPAGTLPSDTTASETEAAGRAADTRSPARQALVGAYPDFIDGFRGDSLLFKDGTTIPFDDGKQKSFTEWLDAADPEDMFRFRYSSDSLPPARNHDPGRARAEELFKKMYGSSADRVASQLDRVDWFGKKVRFSRSNGAADSLRSVAAELALHPELKKYLDCSGTYYWRTVRGASRLSAHSFGIAIDIAVPYSDFWQWRNPRASELSEIKYQNRFPLEIVRIFEKHGFIWGGAWYHYDTMHFEFRPELIMHSNLTK